jgi:hypothetical protein
MYAVWVFGFSWFALYVSCQVGLHSFPLNIYQLPVDMAHWTYSIVHGGQMFGLNLMYLAWGYITAVSFLNFSNYLPADFFSSLSARWTCKKNKNERSGSVTVFEQKSGADINGLQAVHVIHSDNTESKYYIKREEFTFIVGIIKKYTRYLVPFTCGIMIIMYVLPFIGEGPIYLVALKTQFMISCESSWFYGFLHISNLYPWPQRQATFDKDTCTPYVG